MLERVGDRDTFNVPFLQNRYTVGYGSVHQSQRLSLQRVLLQDVMRAYTYLLFLLHARFCDNVNWSLWLFEMI